MTNEQIPDEEDFETANLLTTNNKNRLKTIRRRAVSWLGAISAVVTLIFCAIVVIGPTNVYEISREAKIAFSALILSGFIFFVGSISYACDAAYGLPTKLIFFNPKLRAGIAAEYNEEKRKLADTVQYQAKVAICFFAVGVLLVVAALGVSWFVPRGQLVCLFDSNDKWNYEWNYEGNRTVVAVIRGGVVLNFDDLIVDIGPCP